MYNPRHRLEQHDAAQLASNRPDIPPARPSARRTAADDSIEGGRAATATPRSSPAARIDGAASPVAAASAASRARYRTKMPLNNPPSPPPSGGSTPSGDASALSPPRRSERLIPVRFAPRHAIQFRRRADEHALTVRELPILVDAPSPGGSSHPTRIRTRDPPRWRSCHSWMRSAHSRSDSRPNARYSRAARMAAGAFAGVFCNPAAISPGDTAAAMAVPPIGFRPQLQNRCLYRSSPVA